MRQLIAELAVKVGPVVQGVHLVDAHAAEPLGHGRGLDGVEHRHGLAVGQRHDQVVAVVDKGEDALGRSAGPARGACHALSLTSRWHGHQGPWARTPLAARAHPDHVHARIGPRPGCRHPTLGRVSRRLVCRSLRPVLLTP